MEPRTERVVRALGNRESYAIVVALLSAELTTSKLSEMTGLSAGSLERSLETLSQGSLVSRRPGIQGAWFVPHWPETFALLRAARQLSVAIQGSEERANDEERELFDRLDSAGGATEAAKRGRASHEGG